MRVFWFEGVYIVSGIFFQLRGKLDFFFIIFSVKFMMHRGRGRGILKICEWKNDGRSNIRIFVSMFRYLWIFFFPDSRFFEFQNSSYRIVDRSWSLGGLKVSHRYVFILISIEVCYRYQKNGQFLFFFFFFFFPYSMIAIRGLFLPSTRKENNISFQFFLYCIIIKRKEKYNSVLLE